MTPERANELRGHLGDAELKRYRGEYRAVVLERGLTDALDAIDRVRALLKSDRVSSTDYYVGFESDDGERRSSDGPFVTAEDVLAALEGKIDAFSGAIVREAAPPSAFELLCDRVIADGEKTGDYLAAIRNEHDHISTRSEWFVIEIMSPAADATHAEGAVRERDDTEHAWVRYSAICACGKRITAWSNGDDNWTLDDPAEAAPKPE